MNRFSRVLARIGVLAAPLLALAAPQAQASTQPPAAAQAAGDDFASLNASFRLALADEPSTPTTPAGLRSALLASGAAPVPEPSGELVLAAADVQRSHHARMDSTLMRRSHRHPRPPPRHHRHH
jgi:hypothetical protein